MSSVQALLEQILILGTMSAAVIAIASFMGWGLRVVLRHFGLSALSPFDSGLVSILVVLLLVGFFGAVGLRTTQLLWFIAVVALALGIAWVIRQTWVISSQAKPVPRIELPCRSGFIGALLVLTPFVPLVVLGPTAWTLESNDFALFASWASVWESPSQESFLARHPDTWGREALQGAAIEKPVAIATLSLLSLFSPGSIPKAQTSAFIVVVIASYALSWLTVRNLAGRVPVWAGVLLAVGLAGLYPWARVLHGQWGHAVSVFCLLAAIYWTSRPAGRGFASRGFVSTCVTGAIVGLAFGANAELVALLGLTILGLLVAVSLVVRSVPLRQALLGWSVGALVGASFSIIGALRVLEIWRAIPSESIGSVRPRIPIPSPLGLIGLQPSYGAISPPQSIVLWFVVLAMFIGLALGYRSWRSAPLWIVLGSVAISVVTLVVLFGADNYATGKYVSALIPLVTPPAIAGLVLLPWRSGALVVAVPVSLGAIAISTYWSYSVPIVVPRDLVALESNAALQELEAVNIDLGNYYENHAAALVLPTPRMFVVDAPYGGLVVPSAQVSLVRIDGDRFDETQDISRLNDTYGLLRIPSQ